MPTRNNLEPELPIGTLTLERAAKEKFYNNNGTTTEATIMHTTTAAIIESQ